MGTLALPLAARPPAARAESNDLVMQAMAAMGGRDLLTRVKALSWFGTARVASGGGMVNLTLRAHVEPFTHVRTDSWVTGDTSTMRSMILLPEGGFLERNGNSVPLSPVQTRRAQQQYGLYGYMLLAQPGTQVAPNDGRIAASHAGLPPIRFTTAADGTLTAADYRIVASDGVGMVAQHIRFDGKLSDKGVNWPQTIVILEGGNPYMTLSLESFGVELA